jgi:hypothetical protein
MIYSKAMTNSAPTFGYLGRCRAKGCRHARRIDLAATRVTRYRMWGAERHVYEATVAAVVADGRAHALHDERGYADSYAWRLAFGPHACPEHEGRMEWKPVVGRHNADVRCDARCENARKGDCECSCGGANHGGAHRA